MRLPYRRHDNISIYVKHLWW